MSNAPSAAIFLIMFQSKLILGDCLEQLKTIETRSIDSLITDPPAGIGFMNKGWDDHKGGRNAWVKWFSEVMAECLRTMKPGAHGLVWALPRTSHWTGWALERAGFEVRDCVYHFFGSGFPKSLDISKAIDKECGAKREVIGSRKADDIRSGNMHSNNRGVTHIIDITEPSTEDAKQWEGWGTALKPAVEQYWLIRKPIDQETVALNVRKWSTGALNIDASRINNDQTGSVKKSNSCQSEERKYCSCLPDVRERISSMEEQGIAEQGELQQGVSFPIQKGTKQSKVERGVPKTGRVSNVMCRREADPRAQAPNGTTSRKEVGRERGGPSHKPQPDRQPYRKSGTCIKCRLPYYELSLEKRSQNREASQPKGRFPSNLTLDEDAAKMLDRQSGTLKTGGQKLTSKRGFQDKIVGGKCKSMHNSYSATEFEGDSGGASRFFYVAKPSKRERNLGLETKPPQAVNDGRDTPIDNPFQRGETERQNTHPTVKPIALTRYLCRLITPPGGLVLDPFMGSGTTGCAAKGEGFNFVGIEREESYMEIAKARIEASE